MAKPRRRKYSSKPKDTKDVVAKATIEKIEDTEEVKKFEKVETPVEERVGSGALGEERIEDEVKVVSRPKKIVRKVSKSTELRVSYRKIVYVGTADTSIVRGAVTGTKYLFTKDGYGMPKAINIDEKDYPGIIALKGKGCARTDPLALFMTEQAWDLEIAEAKRGNS